MVLNNVKYGIKYKNEVQKGEDEVRPRGMRIFFVSDVCYLRVFNHLPRAQIV